MFENQVQESFRKISSKENFKKEFCILTNKKHPREIYFEKGNRKSLEFIQVKFRTPKKSVLYFLIKIGLLQNFLKKIKLDSTVGSVVFVGGQIKIFNLKKGCVYSYLTPNVDKKNFLRSKYLQKELGKRGFAPRVFYINKEMPYSEEELLHPLHKFSDKLIFKKLLKYYSSFGFQKIDNLKYIKKIRKKIAQGKELNVFFFEILESLRKKKCPLLLVKSHGDFAKEQVLQKDNFLVFTDWNSSKDLIVSDLVSFFKGEENFLTNKSFLKLLKLYPTSVRKNIKLYLILNEINLVSNNHLHTSLSTKRIKNLISSKTNQSLKKRFLNKID